PIIRIPRPPRPTFTKAKLSSETELRREMREWVQDFEVEGPFDEDVAALAKYLRDVVVLERNTGKAVGIVRWLEWVVGCLNDDGARAGWDGAVKKVKDGVNEGARERGLGRVDFD
ncbi:hypothetical protein M011DRAFT_391330, partial [Sporormia fimetaria CBS 119925]